MAPGSSGRDNTSADVTEITQVVLRERVGRDTADWAAMSSAFAPDSRVRVSWFDGTGEEFVESSRDMYERGSRGFHTIGAVSVDICGDRALASESCTVAAHGVLAGVELDLASHGRLYQRVVRGEEGWRIAELTMVYYTETVTLTDPAADSSPLAGYRFPIDRSYKYLAAILAESGYTIGDNLPGIDRPDLVTPYLAEHQRWLHKESS